MTWDCEGIRPGVECKRWEGISLIVRNHMTAAREMDWGMQFKKTLLDLKRVRE